MRGLNEIGILLFLLTGVKFFPWNVFPSDACLFISVFAIERDETSFVLRCCHLWSRSRRFRLHTASVLRAMGSTRCIPMIVLILNLHVF